MRSTHACDACIPARGRAQSVAKFSTALACVRVFSRNFGPLEENRGLSSIQSDLERATSCMNVRTLRSIYIVYCYTYLSGS